VSEPIIAATGGGGAGGNNSCGLSLTCSESPGGEQKPVVVVTYSVTSSPGANVSSPEARTYIAGETITAEYECKETSSSELKPGSEGCSATLEGSGTKYANGAALPSKPGKFTFKVIATSKDGLVTTTIVKYTVAGKPTATVSGITSGKVYAEGASIHVGFECIEGLYGPGLSECSDRTVGTTESHTGVTRIAGSDHLFTSTPGEYEFEAYAESFDGDVGFKTVKYYVAEPPEPVITSPGSGGIYRLHQSVPTSFHCKESAFTPLASCTDSNGSGSGAGFLRTSEIGAHTYTVTARSKDGQFKSTSVTYTVAAPPKVVITFPHSGGTYHEGEVVETSYRCEESQYGPGLEACDGAPVSGRAVSQTGALDTTGVGHHTYTVTVRSEDEQEAFATISYTVIA
jgi:hypothetical protein